MSLGPIAILWEEDTMKNAGPIVFVIIMLILGLGILFYPDFAHWYNGRVQLEATIEYSGTVGRMREEEREEHFRRAEEYNDALGGIRIDDPFVVGSGAVLPPAYYMQTLNVNGTMAQIEIPRLDINLPVFHTSSMAVLDRGVGHIEGTSFPIGGLGTHAVLTGHSGLAHARMFTPLLPSHGGIELGDIFLIRVLDRTLAYEVDWIHTVLPHEIGYLRIQQDQDFVTLVTCTPYAINSHRLLVRGTRVPYEPEVIQTIVPITRNPLDWRMIIILAFIPSFLLFLFIYTIRDRKNRENHVDEFTVLERIAQLQEQERLERLARLERIKNR